MAESRPSGVPIVPDAKALVIEEIAEIDGRGRIHLLPRWAKRVGWIPVPAAGDVDALMILVEPGLLSLTSWNPDGPRIEKRHDELAALGTGADLEALRSIQDRYQKLPIPNDRRPHLGDAALQHLGLSTKRGAKSNVYVVITPGRIDLLSPGYRNAKSIEGHPSLDDLP